MADEQRRLQVAQLQVEQCVVVVWRLPAQRVPRLGHVRGDLHAKRQQLAARVVAGRVRKQHLLPRAQALGLDGLVLHVCKVHAVGCHPEAAVLLRHGVHQAGAELVHVEHPHGKGAVDGGEDRAVDNGARPAAVPQQPLHHTLPQHQVDGPLVHLLHARHGVCKHLQQRCARRLCGEPHDPDVERRVVGQRVLQPQLARTAHFDVVVLAERQRRGDGRIR
mmetsp:Transcript_236/g.506  ORF Transcript_236/g.506 Transcript_236/m.506 type:complete len:220 (-) Transcript_236:504-1163(-)